MRVFAILLLAGAVAASDISGPSLLQENLANSGHILQHEQSILQHEQSIPGRLINAPSHSQRELFPTRMLNIYGAPPASRENVLPSEMLGLRGLLGKPFVAVFKPEGMDELKAIFIRRGVSGIGSSPDTGFFREYLLSGPEKVGIVLSGAHYLDLPEMSLPIRSLELPHDFTLNGMFRVIQDTPVYPWVFFTVKDQVRSQLDKVVEFGQYQLQPDSVKIVRELTPGLSSRISPYSDFEEVIVEPSSASIPTRNTFVTPYGEGFVKKQFYPESYKKSPFVSYYSVPEEYVYQPSAAEVRGPIHPVHPSFSSYPSSLSATPSSFSPALKKAFYYYPGGSIPNQRTFVPVGSGAW